MTPDVCISTQTVYACSGRYGDVDVDCRTPRQPEVRRRGGDMRSRGDNGRRRRAGRNQAGHRRQPRETQSK